MTSHKDQATTAYVGEEWLNPFEVCAIHIRNCTDEDIIAGRTRVQIAGMTGVASYDICVGDKGAIRLLTGPVQGWLVVLPEPLTEDIDFDTPWFNADGEEFVVIGTHNKCGELGGVAAPAGSRCIKVIASCCKRGDPGPGGPGVDYKCLESVDPACQGQILKSISWGNNLIESADGWTSENWDDATTGIRAAAIAAGLPSDIVVSWDQSTGAFSMKSATTELWAEGDTLSFACMDSPPPPDDSEVTAVNDGAIPVGAGSDVIVNVLDNDSTTEPTGFLRLCDIASVTIPDGGSEIIEVAEGQIIASSSGVIRFIPADGFLGVTPGYGYTVKDANGNTDTAFAWFSVADCCEFVVSEELTISNWSDLNSFQFGSYPVVSNSSGAFADAADFTSRLVAAGYPVQEGSTADLMDGNIKLLLTEECPVSADVT